MFAELCPVLSGSDVVVVVRAAPKTPIALMDIHGTLDTTIPANRTNGYQWPKYQGPDGSTVSDDGMYYTNSTALSSACCCCLLLLLLAMHCPRSVGMSSVSVPCLLIFMHQCGVHSCRR